MIQIELNKLARQDISEFLKLTLKVPERIFLDDGDGRKVDAKEFLGLVYACTFNRLFLSMESADLLANFNSYKK